MKKSCWQNYHCIRHDAKCMSIEPIDEGLGLTGSASSSCPNKCASPAAPALLLVKDFWRWHQAVCLLPFLVGSLLCCCGYEASNAAADGPAGKARPRCHHSGLLMPFIISYLPKWYWYETDSARLLLLVVLAGELVCQVSPQGFCYVAHASSKLSLV